MNSEELEISLRTEFENYLKDVLADMRQEISQLQEKVETELDKHKAQLDVVFQEAFDRINSDKELDAGFKEGVVEHLRLARDEGARITATAMAEAEKLDSAAPASDNSAEVARKFRDAFHDISSKTSQAEILKSLVHHAEEFASRGAFFIIKNEHFVGWRTFGADKGENEDNIREIFFPVSASSLVGAAVRSNQTESGDAYKQEDEALFLNKIGYENPASQVAIPLVVRGRGVAVLYADGGKVNTEALETLVKMASQTVEVLASSRGAAPASKQSSEVSESSAPAAAFTETPKYEEAPAALAKEPEYERVEEKAGTGFTMPVETETHAETGFADDKSFVSDDTSIDADKYQPFQVGTWGKPKVEAEADAAGFELKSDASDSFEVKEEAPAVSFDPAPAVEAESVSDYSFVEPKNDYEAVSSYEFEQAKEPSYEFEQAKESSFEIESPAAEYQAPEAENFNDFASTQSYSKEDFEIVSEKSEFEAEAPISKPADFGSYDFEEKAPAIVEPIEVKEATAAPVAEVSEVAAPPAAKPRFSDRNVDLPIDVAEDERRLHNDARRFARLLVSEIKLYNEQKVKEGRDSNDLYDRLKEAIDRSREMYDKRVQPPVAAKFDYFHYELVNTLAEGEDAKLGSSYPGATS